MPFVATVIPAIFVMGLVTIARLVDIAVEVPPPQRHRPDPRLLPDTHAGSRALFRPVEDAGPKKALAQRSTAGVSSRSQRPPPAWSPSSTASLPEPASPSSSTGCLAASPCAAIALGVVVTLVLVVAFVAYQSWRFSVTPLPGRTEE